MKSKYYNKVLNYYIKGIWNEAKVREAVVKGWITSAEAEEILSSK